MKYSRHLFSYSDAHPYHFLLKFKIIEMLKKLIYLLLVSFILLPSIGFSQKSMILEGEIIDKKTRENVLFCAVLIKETQNWTTTDENGLFSFDNVLPRTYTIEARSLGYEVYSATINLAEYKSKPLSILLVPTMFDMKEVSVVAKRGKGMTTTNTFSSAAIEHVQPTTLGDIMQLLPGSTLKNPDLSEAQQLSIREIGGDANSAMGTALIIDGAPISNDGNLQSLNTATGITGEASTVAGIGVDLRRIPTENIESIEVIKGIPSVVYGDLTSGAVIIKTKAGKTPLNIKLKTDPKIKHFALSKGLLLIKSNSSLNMNIEYLQSYKDVRSKYEGYNRITSDIAWSKTFFKGNKPLSFNAKFSYFGTIDNKKTDPDALVANEEYSSKENGGRFNLHGRWLLNSKFISNIKYSFSYSNTHQVNYQKRYRSSSDLQAISLAKVEGENIGMYLPTEQLTELTIDGRPISFFGQVTVCKIKSFKNDAINALLYGFDYRYTHNQGNGQIYDVMNPPYVSSKTARPRSFKDIPASKSLSFYIEDKLSIPINSTRLTVQAGARLNNFQANGIFKSDIGFYLEPRLNINYSIIHNKNKKGFRRLKINVGIGKTYKAPSLIFMYPDNAYVDLKVLDYYTGDPSTDMVVFYSEFFETANANLKPSENLKKEIGIDFAIGKVRGNITAFHENLTNGFGFKRHYESIHYYTYDPAEIAQGALPDLSSLTKNYSDYFISYLIPCNFKSSEKMGVEFDLHLGKIKSLYTNFSLDGAWFRTKRIYNAEAYNDLPSSNSSTQYEYIGVYDAGESKVNERLNSNLRMVTHIPKLRLIVTTTLQMIWYDKYYYPFYDEVPIYLINKDGNTIPFTEEMRTDPLYVRYVDDKLDSYWLQEIMSPLFLANVRISKEISDNMRLSLYVNNFTNYRPLYQYTRSLSYTRRNPSIYFGAELKIKI